MIKIAPSILAADFSRLKEEVNDLENIGADWIHIDIMDGHFVPNITFGPAVVAAIRSHTKLFLDVHLMIENPDSYINAFAKSGADLISVHQETCPHLHRTINHIKEQGIKAGVVLNPATPTTVLDPIMKHIDMILLMTVNPGFGGQVFIHSMLDKLQQVKKMLNEHDLDHIDIEVDGGINRVTAAQAAECGANIFVAGNAILRASNRKEALAAIRKAANSWKLHRK